MYIYNHVVFDKHTFPYQSGVDFSSVQESCSFQIPSSDSSNDVASHSMIQAFSAPSQVSDFPNFSTSQVPFTSSPTVLPDSLPSTSLSPSNNNLNSLSPSLPSHTLPLSQPPGHSMITRSKAGIFKLKTYLAALLSTPTEPISVCQALADPKWFQAMKEKYNSLQANKT